MMEPITTQVLRLSDDLTLPRATVTHVLGILAMRGMGKCLSEESEIIDPISGIPFTIRQIVEASEINQAFTFDESIGIIHNAPIAAKIDSGIKECFRVMFSSGRSILTTKEHPFLTVDGWQRLGNLQEGASAALPGRMPFPLEPIALPEAEVDLLAILLAEGNYTQTTSTSFTTTDPQILEYASCAAKSMGMVIKHYPSQPAYTYHIVRPMVTFPTHSVKEMLRKYGIDGLKAKNKTIPDVIYRLPPHQLARFLGIFWMCDGYVEKNGGPRMALASEKMLRQIQHLLLRFGIQSRVSPKKASYNGKQFPAWKLTIYAASYQAFLNTIPLWGEKRKRLVALCALSKNSNIGFPTISAAFTEQVKLLALTRSGRWKGAALKEVGLKIGWKNVSNFGVSQMLRGNTLSLKKFEAFCEVYECINTYKWIWNPDIFWDRIVEIKPVGQRHTYDLSVPPTACFIANDILVHNSYLASVLMEEMVRQGLFVGFVDPLGIAWGIRASADGEHEGLPVLILGGRHGDLPLDPSAGNIVAQFLLEQRSPYILDLSLFDTEDQQRAFLADFIGAFRLHENVRMHLIVDESDIFAPQFPQSVEARRSLAAMHQLARRFRFKGMGGTFISQRPAELNKGIMQFDVLMALCTTTPQDIKALDEWIKRNATEAERNTFLTSLSSLPVGTAWVWSPQWLHLFQQIKVRQRTTYDSSKTPEVDSTFVEPKRLAEINLASLSEQMQALIARVQETDPTILQRTIQELREELRCVRAEQPGQTRKSTRAPAKNDEGTRRLLAVLAQAQRDLAERDEKIATLQALIDSLKKLTVSINGASLPFTEIPAHFQRLHIERATITVDQLNGIPMTTATQDVESAPSSQVLELPAEPEKPLTVNDVLVLIPHSQGITLKKLLKKIEELTPNERALFSWLLSNDGSGIRPLDLADAVCINVRATRPDRTSALRRIPFIHHPASTGSYFVSAFAGYAVKAFPGAAAETLETVKQCLLNAAR